MTFYRKNIGGLQQAGRLVLGLASAVAAAVWLWAPWSAVGIAAGVGFALTGLFGFCPLCAMAGIVSGDGVVEPDRNFFAQPASELQLEIVGALEALPASYREVVLMRDVKEMTIAEIAQALGTTRDAAKARLHRARALMREYLTR